MKILIQVICFGLLLSVCISKPTEKTEDEFIPSITFPDTKNRITFEVEIAKTAHSREKGLMYRAFLAEKKGMLFIFDYEAIHSFWMKNTYIPLDIIFINSKKEIVDIIENTQPQSLHVRKPIAPSLYVLEINGGLAKKYGLKKNMRVDF